MKKVAMNDLIDLAFNHARMILIEFKQDQLMPAFSVLREDHTVDIIGTSWADNDEKATMLLYMRQYMKEHSALAYCMISEAWLANYDRSELGKDFLPPSKSDRRIEVVIAVAADREGHKTMRTREIIRDSEGAIVDLADRPGPLDMPTGEMVSLLD